MPRSALVTGAFGFVGRHVARAAADAGYLVTGIGHGSWGRAEWREWGIADWHAADVTLDALVSHGGDPAVIFHCAGSGSVAFSMAHPAQDFDRTVGTTRDVLEYVRLHHPAARLVLPSSAGVYGDVSALPIAVGSAGNPASPYGLHKRMAEDLVRSYGRHFGVAGAIVRLFSIYGPGLRKQLLWDACLKLSRGEAGFGGTGDETRDWLHVEDAAALMVTLAGHAAPSVPVVNGASGTGTPIRAIVGQIAAALPGAPAPAFSGHVRPGDPLHYVADIADARALGWTPRHDLTAGIAGYVDWFRADAS